MSLIKLKIEAFKDAQCTSSTGLSVTALFNPDTYSRSYGVNYETLKVLGQSGATQTFSGMSGGDLKIKLIADGTGVVPLPNGIENVDAYIQTIYDVIYKMDGSSHRPNFLKVEWGILNYICVCKSINITSTLFKEDGTTLRANIELSLSDSIDYKTKEKKAAKKSADLTHVRTVKAGDTLPLMSYRIYGDSSYYLEVAQVNKLSSVNGIKPGDQIYFPPIKK